MTIYYRDESLRVTARQIQTLDGVYPLAELNDVCLVYGHGSKDTVHRPLRRRC